MRPQLVASMLVRRIVLAAGPSVLCIDPELGETAGRCRRLLQVCCRIRQRPIGAAPDAPTNRSGERNERGSASAAIGRCRFAPAGSRARGRPVRPAGGGGSGAAFVGGGRGATAANRS